MHQVTEHDECQQGTPPRFTHAVVDGRKHLAVIAERTHEGKKHG